MTASDPRVSEIQARIDAITPGEWMYHSGTSVVEVLPKFDLHRFDQMSTDIFKVQESDADGVFAAAAPSDIAYLLAELADRDEKLADVLAIADIGMNSEHGDPAFIQGWQCAVEEIKARIEPVGNES